ncbi:MAG: TMEM175 family protein [Promethearchaeota archaeon]
MNNFMSKERVEFFSDAVFAIILTLLVLELHVPEIEDHSSFDEYVTAMIPLIPKFISFILSFVMVSIYWVNHHYFFRHIHTVTLGLVWVNNLLLLTICFIPFPTALLGSHPTDQFPIMVYGLNSLISSLAFSFLRGYSIRNKLLEVDDESIKILGPRHSIPGIFIYTLSIIFSFINVYISLACFFLVPVLYFVPGIVRIK